jgi:hypothetical protein
MAAAGCGGGKVVAAPSGPQVLTEGSKIEVTPLSLRRHGREVTIDVRSRNIGDSVDATDPGLRGHLVLAGDRRRSRRPASAATTPASRSTSGSRPATRWWAA